MSAVLDRNAFVVKEHVSFLKAANNFDMLCPETGEELIHCREENMGFLTKLFRFSKVSEHTPFNIEMRTPEGERLLSVRRGIGDILTKVNVFDANDALVGGFEHKRITMGTVFRVLDANDREACILKGNWTGRNYKFMRDEHTLATVAKKWGGLGKELFTAADTYMISINPSVPPGSPGRKLILGAVICVDLVANEDDD